MTSDVDARIETELKRGLLQLAILSMARRPTYGYRLAKALAERGLGVEEGTLYPILRRLEKHGLLESLWKMGDTRPRKYYVITEAGRGALGRLLETWTRIRGALDAIMEDDES